MVITIGFVAVAFLSSSVLAGIVGAVTIAAVLVDMYTFSRTEDAPEVPEPFGVHTPERITVDLSRRS